MSPVDRASAPGQNSFFKKQQPRKSCTLCSGIRCTLCSGICCTLYSEILSHDSEALFSLFGCVSHTDLLRKLPPEPPEPPAVLPLLNSMYSHFSYKVDYSRHISDKLNANYYVHEHALNCLRKHGWVQKGIFFTRPGKTNSSAISATFSIPERYSIYIFYNFSSNAAPFQPAKGYTDCQIISLLQHNGDYARCISALMDEYDSQIRA